MNEETGLKLSYRESTKRVYRQVLIGLVIAELVIIRLNIFKIVEEDMFWAIVKLLLASTVPISIFIRMFFFLRPAINSNYELFNDRLKIQYKKLSREILFSQVQQVKFSFLSPRFLGGFTLRLNSGQKVLFLSALKDNYLVLENVVKMNPQLVPPQKLEAYLKNSKLVELSWDRMKEKTKNWKILLSKWVGIPLVFSLVGIPLEMSFASAKKGWNQFLALLLFFFLINSLLALLMNHLEERMVLNNVVETTEELKRDEAYEKKLQNIIGVSFALTSLLIFLITFYFLSSLVA